MALGPDSDTPDWRHIVADPEKVVKADVGREERSNDDDAPDAINPTRRQLVNVPSTSRHVNVPNAAPAEDDGRPTPRSPRPTKRRSWWRAEELAVVADFAANPSKRFRDIGELAAALPGRSSGAAWLKTGTANSVDMVEDAQVDLCLIERGLSVLGWIHTHPSQTAFLSSVDLHTQFSYQQLLPEAVAVVCAPSYGANKWLRLTGDGMKIVADCPFRGFHSHVSRGKLFGPALSIIFVDTSVTTIDMRSSGDLPSPLMPPADGIQLDHATPGQEPNQTAPPAAAPVSETGQRDAKGVVTCDITATEQDAMRPRYDAAPAGTVNSFSRLRRLAVKLEKYKSHRDFLETCTADGLIPRGFRLTWKCHFDDQNEEVERTLEKASQELVRISAEVAAARVTHLEGEYQTLSEQVGANATRDEQAHSAVIVQKDVQRTKDFTTRTKKRKLDRLRPNQRSQTAGDGPGQTPRPPEPVGVVNLSSRQLTPTELALLTRGLSFVPSRKQTIAQLTAELKEWERLMRLREFWHNSNDNQPREANDTEDAAYKKAKWVPPKGRDPWLD
ncbi:STAM-binding protein [Amphibalanus amphitrite]|uniref:STAM-binding protein n=1 Tax=Amphibalanus amphitrite TaxID=1232801 RepID=A0A6A4VTH8_AMPAM|nr:STAM-binding protein [Amphibalanus amphitrite]